MGFRYWISQTVATVLAMAGVAATIVLYTVLSSPPPKTIGPILNLGALLVLFTGLFSFVVFGLLASQQRQLIRANIELKKQRDNFEGLWQATRAITTLADDQDVLQRVVDVARDLLHAKYGAMAVVREEEPSLIQKFITSGISLADREKIGRVPTGKGLLGEVIRNRKPIILNRIQDHPASIGFPAHHPAMKTFLGLPILYQDKILGHLYLTDKADGFTQDDKSLAELFTRQAAVVIANAQLYQDRERWATLQERERIGRDLHDGVLQTLYGITLALDALLDSEQNMSPIVAKELSRIADTLGLTMTEIRLFIQTLAASSVDFKAALWDMLQRLGPITDIRLDFQDNTYLQLDPELIHDLVMCAQEAVSNARRHGQASQITIGWALQKNFYKLWINDDGQGFNPNAVRVTQFGLKNMKRRMERWNGQLTIDSRPGSGARVTLSIAASVPSNHETKSR